VTLLRRLARRPADRRSGERGQSLIELSIAIPVVLLLLLGMLEFGFAFSHHLTLEYATREGARTGAALAAGTGEVACTGANNTDAYTIAAVQRVLTGTGGQVPIGQVKEIRIYKASSTGADSLGLSNKWVPGAGGPSVDGVQLLFTRSGSTFWDPCTRHDSPGAWGGTDSIGVSLIYDYQYITPLGNLMGLGGAPVLQISDRTIMALNPAAN
jgi:Flp pilus assembly protein TadG